MKLVTIIILIFSSISILAQNEASVWYFGELAGIKFDAVSGRPTALTDSQMDTKEGCASISDSNGDLLFYTDGNRVWNRNHEIMENGFGLSGHFSSTQSGVIVPKPGSDSLYYLFTVDEGGYVSPPNEGLNYSVVDMSLDNGLGSVLPDQRNIRLVAPATEKITAVSTPSEDIIWIVTHLWESNSFHAYKITESGLDLNPVICDIGVIHTGTFASTIGYMKASPTGNKLALAIEQMNIIEVFDFDNATGIISNPLRIDLLPEEKPYGIEFSPDGRLLYAKTYTDRLGRFTIIHQIDLSELNHQDPFNSFYTVSKDNINSSLGALQLGPDGRIYCSNDKLKHLSSITFPNIKGPGCEYVAISVDLNGRSSRLGLPNFIQSFFKLGQVWLPYLICIAGQENVEIPINFKIKNSNRLPGRINIEAVVSFNLKLFEPYISANIVNDEIVGDKRFLTINSSMDYLQGQVMTAAIIKGTVLLADTSSTPLVLERFTVMDSISGLETYNGHLDVYSCASEIAQVEFIEENLLNTYPNPASDHIYVAGVAKDAENSVIYIYSYDGSLVYQEKINRQKSYKGNFNFDIDSSGFSSGLYYVVLRSAGSYKSKSVIIR